MNYYHNIDPVNIENGNGIRCVVWLSGCVHHCPGCFNPETWPYDSGVEITEEFYDEIREALSKDYCAGLTITGGDPMSFRNLHITEKLIDITKNEFHKSVWIWSGYQLELLLEMPKTLEMLKNVDVLVDGKFIEEFSCKEYHWAGSVNQRVIDVQKTLEFLNFVINDRFIPNLQYGIIFKSRIQYYLRDTEVAFLEPDYSIPFRVNYFKDKDIDNKEKYADIFAMLNNNNFYDEKFRKEAEEYCKEITSNMKYTQCGE